MKGGAETIALCDTNGGSLPWQMETIVTDVIAKLGGSVRVGVHLHDDTGCAVANSLAAIRVGATHVQGTMNGYGERCGNANLCIVIPNIELKLKRRALPEGALARLHETARFVAEVTNFAPNDQMPYVGNSAFAHKAGVHVAAMQRHPDAYQHIDPTVVGNEMRVVVSELSGRANVVSKASELGLQNVDAAIGAKVVEVIKAKEHEGFSFEAAEASVALLVRRLSRGLRAAVHAAGLPRHGQPPWRAQHGRGDHQAQRSAATRCTRRPSGNGPVNAFDQALRKALQPLFPQVKDISLADYKVRILNSGLGTAAITRVLIDWHDGVRRWSTVGAGGNILDATWLALADGYEYGLTPTTKPAEARG